MFIRIFCLVIITGWFQVQCNIPVPSTYRKVEVALHHYSSNGNHNPVIYSLLNVLVHDKLAKAFITNEAIEKSLEDVKKFNEDDEQSLRQLIYDRKNLFEPNELPDELKQEIESALDTLLLYPNTDDYETSDLLPHKKRL
jgi:hypothetical protein